jgi:hypothetical protein
MATIREKNICRQIMSCAESVDADRLNEICRSKTVEDYVAQYEELTPQEKAKFDTCMSAVVGAYLVWTGVLALYRGIWGGVSRIDEAAHSHPHAYAFIASVIVLIWNNRSKPASDDESV